MAEARSGAGPLAGLAEALASLQAVAVGGSQAQARADLRGVGTAADGKVRAEVSAAGRLEALSIEPAVLRSGVVSLADLVLEAVQAAQDDVAFRSRQVVAGMGLPAPEGLSVAAAAAEAGMARVDQMMEALGEVSRRLDGGSR